MLSVHLENQAMYQLDVWKKTTAAQTEKYRAGKKKDLETLEVELVRRKTFYLREKEEEERKKKGIFLLIRGTSSLLAFTTLFDFESKTEQPVEPVAEQASPDSQPSVLPESVPIVPANATPEPSASVAEPTGPSSVEEPAVEQQPEAEESSDTEELPAVEILADEDYAPE